MADQEKLKLFFSAISTGDAEVDMHNLVEAGLIDIRGGSQPWVDVITSFPSQIVARYLEIPAHDNGTHHEVLMRIFGKLEEMTAAAISRAGWIRPWS